MMGIRGPLIVVALYARLAHADDVSDLEARGEELAKHSDYTQAIETFKAADARRPRAAHACMIGLAYLRRELWPQAEMFLALCEKRAAPGDQPPPWIDEAEHQLAAKLSGAQIPAVTFVVAPGDAHITVSSFAPDESFTPQTIHLLPGKQLVEVSAPGYSRASREITIRSGEPQTITFTLQRDPNLPVERPAPAPHLGPQPSRVPWIVMGAGAAIAAIGLGYDAGALQPARDRLATTNPVAYGSYVDDFATKQKVTLVWYGAGALTIAVGVVLHYVIKSPPQLAAQLGDHGGVIAIGWQR